MENLAELVICALQEEALHHKQWYLEEILKSIITPEMYAIVKTYNEWAKGIAP